MIKPNFTYKAQVTGVVDGDTIDVIIDMGFSITTKQRLRLLRVNTPELHASDPAVRTAALESKAYTVEAVAGKEIIIITEKDDAFGRYLAEVYYMVGDVQHSLNSELLEKGLAVPYQRK